MSSSGRENAESKDGPETQKSCVFCDLPRVLSESAPETGTRRDSATFTGLNTPGPCKTRQKEAISGTKSPQKPDFPPGKRAKTAGEPAVFLEGEEMKKRETTKRRNTIYGNGKIPRDLHRPQVDGKKRKRSAGVFPLAETKDTRGGGGSGDEFVSEM